MLSTPTTYPVETYDAGKEILHALRERFKTTDPRQSLQPISWYDSFDWRLFRAGGTLSAQPLNRGWELRWCALRGELLHRLRMAQVPAFAWEFPAGPGRDRIGAVLGVRRLLPRVRAEFAGEVLSVLDAAGRVVAEVDIEEGTAGPGDRAGDGNRVAPRVRLRPREGNPEYYRRIVFLLESDLGLHPGPCRRFDRAIAAVGVEPGGYSSRLNLTLERSMPVFEAARQIHLSLMATIRANEDGVRRGLDTEFLHDLRVAVRRTRTCLAQLKEIFPPERVAHFRDEFGWLGEVTGPPRDLDVYLLEMPRYRALLPEEMHEDLEPLFRFLRKRRAAEQSRLVEMLDSLRYRRLLREWPEFLTGAPDLQAFPAAALRPAGEAADERIGRRFKRALKRGAAIDDSSPAQRLHALRIECKKLRYLLEFFRSLYDAGDLEPLLARLRGLQDDLGEINDLQVQREALTRFAREMDPDDGATPETFLAMGRLQERLNDRQRKRRRRFGRSFSRLAGHRTRDAMDRLLGAARGEKGPEDR
jgi:CHAD domain-containing protein